jgi:diguanylate cyclase
VAGILIATIMTTTTTPSRTAAAVAQPAAADGAPMGADLPPAQIAKAALRRLALERLEPTPDNFARAYASESGDAPDHRSVAPSLPAAAMPFVERLMARAASSGGVDAQRLTSLAKSCRWDEADRLLAAAPEPAAPSGDALADLIERMLRGLDIAGKQWTRARKRDSLQRVLSGSRSDASRLQARLSQLVSSWQDDRQDGQLEEIVGADAFVLPDRTPAAPEPAAPAPTVAAGTGAGTRAAPERLDWLRAADALGGTVCAALPSMPTSAAALIDTAPADLARRIADRTRELRQPYPEPGAVDDLEVLCRQADRVLQHREHLLDQLGKLVNELTTSLGELAEDDTWARGQCNAMQGVLEQGLSTRGVRSVSELLRVTRERQHTLRDERERARDALKSLIQRMLADLGELGSHTGRFRDSMDRYAGVIEGAESLESLTGLVREMVEESRTVAGLVGQTQERLQAEHSRAQELSSRVEHLESELRRLSAEVSTDQLTQVANRRGLIAQFEIEQARCQREGSLLCLGLIDIDNFKRLNDQLGHAAGDIALKSLAQAVRQALRPTDMVARFGGEEFVVVLPGTPLDEAQQILTRLQRGLTGSLFMHDDKPVFVTFSAGVTDYRPGESLESALERADQGLYEAKRTGKNRTCVA